MKVIDCCYYVLIAVNTILFLLSSLPDNAGNDFQLSNDTNEICES